MPLKKGQASEAFKEGKLEKHNFKNLSVERRKEISRKGVEKRIENNKKRKEMNEQMQMLLNLDIASPKNKKLLKELGIDSGMMNNQMLLLTALMKKGFTGDVNAIKEIRDIIGGEENKTSGEQKIVINISPISSKDEIVEEEDDFEEWEEEDEW